VISKAKTVNVQSQITVPEGVDDLFDDDAADGVNDHFDGDAEDEVEDKDEDYKDEDFSGIDDDDGRTALSDYGGITDYTANEYDIHERVAHFMGRRSISTYNRMAVEAVYMVEALTLVRGMRTMRKPEIAQHVQERYKALIHDIDPARFADNCIKVKMEEKYFRAKGTSADGLLTKATEVLKNVRALAAGIRGVGSPLHQIPSGKSLTDVKNEFILKQWSATQGEDYVPSNNDEDEIPDGWWLLHPSANLLLAVLVHRCNPDVVADPREASAGATREILRADARGSVIERREKDKIVENHGTQRQRAEDSMLQSKAQLMEQTIDSGKIDQVKEQLTLLSQFKESYINVQNRINGAGKGSEDYDQTAHELLSELPFMKKRRTETHSESTS